MTGITPQDIKDAQDAADRAERIIGRQRDADKLAAKGKDAKDDKK